MSRITINSNILSLSAQRRLYEHSKSIDTTYTRLSSGLRINKASDDAAGLSISSLLTADKKVSNQGIRNLNDGISYLNVAEGAINELSSIVTRISELAEQGANGTLGNSQREALQQEVTSLEAEYNRIIKTTSFNGNALLTGLTTSTKLQGGYGLQSQLGVQVGETSLGQESDLTRAGLTTRIDTDSNGNIGNGASAVMAVSADGRYATFHSSSTNLVSGDTNAAQDVFVKDTITGLTTRVSTSSSGTQSNFDSQVRAISADGRYVGFHSLATNLVSNDTNGFQDAFIKDTLTGTLTRVSTDSNGNQGDGSSTLYSVSADGRFITFASNSTNLVSGDTNGATDIFIKDMITGTTTRVSTSSNGTEGDSSSSVPSISSGGRYIAFYSSATNLVSGDVAGMFDVFLKDTTTGIITRVSTGSSGNEGNGNSFTNASSVSADGRYVSFYSSSTNIVSGDTNGFTDVFMKDTVTGATTLVSTNSNGSQGNSNSFLSAMSADGRYVVFYSTANNLVSDDTNGVQDTFIKDMHTGETIRVNSNDVVGSTSSYSISADGRFAVFSDNLNAKAYLADLSKTGINQIAGMIVSNQASSKITIDLSKKYLNELSEYRAQIGTSLSRAQTFINTLEVQSENYAAASSQITDTDVATESANLTKTQILQQAANSILAQANQQPQLALKLLGNI